MRGFGGSVGSQIYRDQQSFGSGKMRTMPSNEYNANKYGLGYGGGQEGATSKYFNVGTDSDNNKTPRMGRTRTSKRNLFSVIL